MHSKHFIVKILALVFVSVHAYGGNDQSNRASVDSAKTSRCRIEEARLAQRLLLLNEPQNAYRNLTAAHRVMFLVLTRAGEPPLSKSVVFTACHEDCTKNATFTASFRAHSLEEAYEIYRRYEAAVTEARNEWDQYHGFNYLNDEWFQETERLKAYSHRGPQVRMQSRPYDLIVSRPSADELKNRRDELSPTGAFSLLPAEEGEFLLVIRGHHGGTPEIAAKTFRSLMNDYDLMDAQTAKELGRTQSKFVATTSPAKEPGR